MNDTTYTAYILDTHRAADLVRQNEMMRAHRERGASLARPAVAASEAGGAASIARRSWWPHRGARRTTFVATR